MPAARFAHVRQYPSNIAAQQRYYADSPRGQRGHAKPRYQLWEDELIRASTLGDHEIAATLRRSTRAVQIRRSRLRRERAGVVWKGTGRGLAAGPPPGRGEALDR